MFEALDSEVKISYQQWVTHIIQCSDAEHSIEHSTHCSQSNQINDSLAKWQRMCYIVDGGEGKNNERPYRRNENTKPEGQSKRIERRMIIEMSPRFRSEQLDATIKHR